MRQNVAMNLINTPSRGTYLFYLVIRNVVYKLNLLESFNTFLLT